jgi:hypothetical protein
MHLSTKHGENIVGYMVIGHYRGMMVSEHIIVGSSSYEKRTSLNI